MSFCLFFFCVFPFAPFASFVVKKNLTTKGTKDTKDWAQKRHQSLDK